MSPLLCRAQRVDQAQHGLQSKVQFGPQHGVHVMSEGAGRRVCVAGSPMQLLEVPFQQGRQHGEQGMLARFSEDEVRPMGRDAAGVIAIRLARQGDAVVSMSVVQPVTDLLVLTETGYGKRVALTEFRRKHRGGQGVRLIALEGRKTGLVAAVQQVTDADEELVLISSGGQVIRTDVHSVNRYSSGARGVIVMRLGDGDTVAAIAAFRAGLAERGAMGDNDAPQPGPGGSEGGNEGRS